MIHPVHRSLNKLLTILGVDRKLFSLWPRSAPRTFNFFGSLLCGIAMFGVLYGAARLATTHDP
jgi:hypothetical protein